MHSTGDDIVVAGENALVALYVVDSVEKTLIHVAYNTNGCKKLATHAEFTYTAQEPPTSAAAPYYSLRVYLQGSETVKR